MATTANLDGLHDEMQHLAYELHANPHRSHDEADEVLVLLVCELIGRRPLADMALAILAAYLDARPALAQSPVVQKALQPYRGRPAPDSWTARYTLSTPPKPL